MDIQGLTKVVSEANVLSGRLEGLSKREQRRLDFLISASAAIRSGASLEDIEEIDITEQRREHGIVTPYQTKFTAEQRMLYGWLATGRINEQRSETIGYGPNYTLAGSQGAFVPVQFFGKVLRAQAQHSPLFDAENVTLVSSDSGGIMQVPWFSDIENVATQIGENSADTSDTGIAQVDGTQLRTWNFRTPRILCSYESVGDIPFLEDLIADVLGDRLARGVGTTLLTGNGVNTVEGLLSAITLLGATILANGSSANDGYGTRTSVNSIGQQDLIALLFSVPAPYRNSLKFSFLLNSNTLAGLSYLTDKSGRPLIDTQADRLTLFGKRVLIDEGMPNIGLNNYPVIAGDLSYWCTRVCPGSMYIQRYTEAAGLVEAGKFAFRLFCREGGVLMYSDSYQKSPIWALQNASS